MAIAIFLFLLALIVVGVLVYGFAPAKMQTPGLVAFGVALLVMLETFARLNAFKVLP